MNSVISKKTCTQCHEHLSGFAVLGREQVTALNALREFERNAWIEDNDELGMYYSWLVSAYLKKVVEEIKVDHKDIKFCPFCGAPVKEEKDEEVTE